MSFTNVKQFTASVKKQIIDEVAKNALKFEQKANELALKAIDDVEAVDTGEMQSRTFAKSKVNLNSNDLVVVNFKTQNSKYAVFVHEGLGTNRAYGRRPFLEIARKQLLEEITTGSHTPVIKSGSPNKGFRKVTRRQ